MATHALTTTAPSGRRLPSDTLPTRILTSLIPGEILLGFDATFQGIAPTADQVRAAYRSNGDRLPANLRSGLARAFFG
ncbi:hypothetical protein JMJ56_29435 [Belnapia sp. T18]|uniref:Uncharacterized protein n=1 Tax=Belnapia arida TaxID=2804533 RepID=A0ABS1UDT0_9PROT|nr:hypothetical protein [Belnapia arida]MBL6082104.1 hypothetical protein [Belnapia arida]